MPNTAFALLDAVTEPAIAVEGRVRCEYDLPCRRTLHAAAKAFARWQTDDPLLLLQFRDHHCAG
jgi:hypothetical protein